MRKSHHGLLLGLLALGGMLSVGLSSDARQEKAVDPSKKVIGILGDDTIAVLKAATKVECYRIQPEKSIDATIKRIAEYPILAVGKEQGKDFAARLNNVLFTDATYEGDSAKCFDPGVIFRVWTDKKEWVDIIICFHCQNFVLTSYDANGKIVKRDVFGAFGGTPSRKALVKLAKEAFPDDKAIQNLAEETK
jgi:hypothetical protein